MVRQIRRSCGLSTAKMAKATETPSGSSTQGEIAWEALAVGSVQSLRHEERTLDPRVLLHQRGLTDT